MPLHASITARNRPWATDRVAAPPCHTLSPHTHPSLLAELRLATNTNNSPPLTQGTHLAHLSHFLSP
eukprot:scaffold2022_cov63-Phaeocystis_antarctica.AAC.4